MIAVKLYGVALLREEDVNIYRQILSGELDSANLRMGLHAVIADLTSELET